MIDDNIICVVFVKRALHKPPVEIGICKIPKCYDYGSSNVFSVYVYDYDSLITSSELFSNQLDLSSRIKTIHFLVQRSTNISPTKLSTRPYIVITDEEQIQHLPDFEFKEI